MNITHYRLPDTRAYPTDPVKNDLLLYAAHIADHQSKAQTTLARESLHAEIGQMLAQNHYVPLSVAMAMAANADIYSVLWQSLAEVLQARTPDERQWLALPVVIVAGSKQATPLPHTVPVVEIAATLSKMSWAAEWNRIRWLPHLLGATDLTAIKAHQWFAAKQSQAEAGALLQQLLPGDLMLEEGQSVRVLYALGFADNRIQPALNAPLGEAALPLMQVWQTHLHTEDVTLFANPLPPMAPMAAIHEGSVMRLRMACDVFTANAIRAIRLQSPRVGVVIAAQAGGRLLFGFNATDSAFELEPQVFSWPLSPMDNIDIVVQNLINLLTECQVEHIRLLHEPLHEQAELPNYAQALHMLGHNPLFAESH